MSVIIKKELTEKEEEDWKGLISSTTKKKKSNYTQPNLSFILSRDNQGKKLVSIGLLRNDSSKELKGVEIGPKNKLIVSLILVHLTR